MLSRRQGERLNRGRVSVGLGGGPGPPAAGFDPTSISGLTLWLDSEYQTDGGNGTPVTAATDRSATGASVVEGASGVGPLRLDAGTSRRGRTVCHFSTGKYLKTLNAAVAAICNGAPADFTVIELYQPISSATAYSWSWGSTSLTTRYVAKRRGSSNYLDDITRRDGTNNSSIIIGPIENLTPQIHICLFDATAATVAHRIDGTQTALSPVALPRATQSIDVWMEGALATGAAPSIASAKYRRHEIVYNRKLTAGECQQFETWLATEMGPTGIGLKWKRGIAESATFGNASNATLVVGVIGQSNGSGRGTSSTYTSTYAGTSNQGFVHYNDGYLAAAADPTADNTNVVGGGSADGAPAGSAWIRMIDRLRSQGETRNIIVVNCCVGGTTSTQWNTTPATSPPPINGLVGQAKHRIMEALKAPNSELVLVVYQGESNTTSSALAAIWATDWAAVLNEFNSYFSSFFVKTKRHFIVNLPVTAWTLATDWATLRSNITTFAGTTRTDCTEIQAPDGPWVNPGTNDWLHLDMGVNTGGSETGLLKLGILAADANRAAV